jgi:hypothetical protein
MLFRIYFVFIKEEKLEKLLKIGVALQIAKAILSLFCSFWTTFAVFRP